MAEAGNDGQAARAGAAAEPQRARAVREGFLLREPRRAGLARPAADAAQHQYRRSASSRGRSAERRVSRSSSASTPGPPTASTVAFRRSSWSMPASSGSPTFPPRTLRPVVLIECPRLLFPFARQIIADASRNGGFPPLLIDPVDFVAHVPPAACQAAGSAAASAGLSLTVVARAGSRRPRASAAERGRRPRADMADDFAGGDRAEPRRVGAAAGPAPRRAGSPRRTGRRRRSGRRSSRPASPARLRRLSGVTTSAPSAPTVTAASAQSARTRIDRRVEARRSRRASSAPKSLAKRMSTVRVADEVEELGAVAVDAEGVGERERDLAPGRVRHAGGLAEGFLGFAADPRDSPRDR